MTNIGAISVLESMAVDMTGAMAGLNASNPMADVLRRRLDAIDAAQDALRAQLEKENPKPLTLDELREMDGEPVWCVSIIAKKSEWAILRIVETPKTWLIAVAGAAAGYGDKNTYGKTWLAYRNRQEGV